MTFVIQTRNICQRLHILRVESHGHAKWYLDWRTQKLRPISWGGIWNVHMFVSWCQALIVDFFFVSNFVMRKGIKTKLQICSAHLLWLWTCAGPSQILSGPWRGVQTGGWERTGYPMRGRRRPLSQYNMEEGMYCLHAHFCHHIRWSYTGWLSVLTLNWLLVDFFFFLFA